MTFTKLMDMIAELGVMDVNNMLDFNNRMQVCEQALADYLNAHSFVKKELNSLKVAQLHDLCRVAHVYGWWYKNKQEIISELCA